MIKGRHGDPPGAEDTLNNAHHTSHNHVQNAHKSAYRHVVAVGMSAGMAVRGGADWAEQSYVVVAAVYVQAAWAWDSSMNTTTTTIAAGGAWRMVRLDQQGDLIESSQSSQTQLHDTESGHRKAIISSTISSKLLCVWFPESLCKHSLMQVCTHKATPLTQIHQPSTDSSGSANPTLETLQHYVAALI